MKVNKKIKAFKLFV